MASGYFVTRKVGPVTFEILCPDKKRQRQILHINLLREFKERALTQAAKPVMIVRVAEDRDTSSTSYLVLPGHLTEEQQAQQTHVQASFPSLFQERPGHTKVISHDIVFKDSTPV